MLGNSGLDGIMAWIRFLHLLYLQIEPHAGDLELNQAFGDAEEYGQNGSADLSYHLA
ncbi:MAG: hypothetical protein Q7U40_09285 [Desulfatirhabdiaceae bacterium]|nr:hypothetical protein [Desulfatirhabdiaceae bacterium]